MLSTVCPRLGGRTLVLAPCERLGDPAREVRYWRTAAIDRTSALGRKQKFKLRDYLRRDRLADSSITSAPRIAIRCPQQILSVVPLGNRVLRQPKEFLVAPYQL